MADTGDQPPHYPGALVIALGVCCKVTSVKWSASKPGWLVYAEPVEHGPFAAIESYHSSEWSKVKNA